MHSRVYWLPISKWLLNFLVFYNQITFEGIRLFVFFLTNIFRKTASEKKKYGYNPKWSRHTGIPCKIKMKSISSGAADGKKLSASSVRYIFVWRAPCSCFCRDETCHRSWSLRCEEHKWWLSAEKIFRLSWGRLYQVLWLLHAGVRSLSAASGRKERVVMRIR